MGKRPIESYSVSHIGGPCRERVASRDEPIDQNVRSGRRRWEQEESNAQEKAWKRREDVVSNHYVYQGIRMKSGVRRIQKNM